MAHTVVVFGGTRIEEPRAAARDTAPADAALHRQAEVAARRVTNSRYYEMARAFGRLVGAAGGPGRGVRLMVMTGGAARAVVSRP